MDAKPIIKYVGGKTRLLPELVARMPPTFGTYYEPFCGGAALFFRLRPARAILSDTNLNLINLYWCVREPQTRFEMVQSLLSLKRQHNKRGYYRARTQWNSGKPTYNYVPHRAALFLYLNRTCFNGLWRVNKAGEFNVPMGRYKNPTILYEEEIEAAAAAFQRADIQHRSYAESVKSATAGDFVFMDPPYDPLTPTASFTAYGADGFGRAHQKQLAECARDLVKRGVQVMLSNHDTPFIRKIYRGFNIDRVGCVRAVNSNGAKRGAVGEVIITGGYTPPAMTDIDRWAKRVQMPRDQFLRQAAARFAQEIAP